jgi:hypothetical protein
MMTTTAARHREMRPPRHDEVGARVAGRTLERATAHRLSWVPRLKSRFRPTSIVTFSIMLDEGPQPTPWTLAGAV